MSRSARIILVCLTMVFFLTVFCDAAEAKGIWSTTDKGYKVWNESPQPNETFTWTGDVDSEGYATGNGLLQCYQSGKPNGKYEGNLLKGKATGKGVFTYPDGSRYEGGYLDGKENGQGILTLTGGGSYSGDIVAGKPSGKGVFTLPDGDRY